MKTHYVVAYYYCISEKNLSIQQLVKFEAKSKVEALEYAETTLKPIIWETLTSGARTAYALGRLSLIKGE